jgi:WD40 repeat protein
VGLKQVGNERVIALANGISARTNGAAEGALTPSHRETRIAENAILSPDGINIAVCEDAKTVLIAKVAGGEIVAALHHLNPVLYAAFSPNGKRLLTACADRSVRLWDVANGELLSPPISHSLAVERVFFHEGDSRAGVVHQGDRASIWNLEEDNRPVKDLGTLAELLADGHNDPISKSPTSDSKSMRAKWEKLSSAK